ncbi:MAG TPA: DpnI domain-containing protein [Gammaproteobacteria bacterium]|nr:DpnI domain-containing protein [Gammaproteobacteria bacterium]
MKLEFNKGLVATYTSPTQRARVLTESWVHANAYCPSCGCNSLEKYQNNRPATDFFCSDCREDFELKSQKSAFGAKIVDGAYDSMIRRLRSSSVPNLFALNYDSNNGRVCDLVAVPSHFFAPSIIERRKPLAETARRAGWVGCNILFSQIPRSGRVAIVKEGVPVQKTDVLAAWKRMLFLREQAKPEIRGWSLDVIKCIEKLNKTEFSLTEIYRYESELAALHPNNKNIRPKIRQRLQVLRDAGYLEFLGRGNYRVV